METVKEKSTNGHLTPTEARAIIEAEAQKRVEQCQAEARAAHDSCDSGTCNAVAQKAYADCKKRLGVSQ